MEYMYQVYKPQQPTESNIQKRKISNRMEITSSSAKSILLKPNSMKTISTSSSLGNLSASIRLMLIMLLMLSGWNASAQVTKTSASAGNWSTITWSPAGLPAAGDHVIIAHAVTANVAISVGNLTVNSGSTLTMSNQNVTAAGNTIINGTLADNNAAGTNTFSGSFTVGATGNFTTTSTSPLVFGGNISNSGTFNRSGAGAVTFTNSLSMGGPNVIALGGGTATLAADAVVTNNGSVTFLGTINGTNTGSTWINAASSSLAINGTTPMATGTFDVSATLNNVTYGGANQTIKSATYFNIIFGGSGTKTIPDIVVNGNFSRNAGTLAFSGSSLTFESSSSAILSLVNASVTLPNVVINKPGGVLTINPGGAVTTTMASLSVSDGDFNLGSTNTTVRVNGTLAGSGTIDMSSASGHILRLFGTSNNIASLLGTSGTVEYAATGDQEVFSTANYRTLLLSGSGIKSLTGNATVSTLLNLSSNLLLSLGNSNLRLTANATLAGTFGTSRYIVTDASGAFIKEGTATGDFTTDIPTGVYPLGNSGGLYTPFTLSALTATITGTGAISVRAVPTRQPNVPYFNNALIKYWDIVTTNLSGISANASFQYRPSEVIGNSLLYQPRVWNGSALVSPAGASSAGTNPATTTATTFLTGQWTSLDPATRTTLYSYQSGDWADPNTWTIDPSGSTLLNPIVPSAGDQVIILPGRNVYTTVSRTIGSIEIQSAAILDLGTSTGHNFGVVSGEGTLKISAAISPAAFPVGTFTDFVAATGGTVEYYNLPATCVLPAQATYNNLLFTNSTSTSFTAQVNNGLTINGSLSLSRSGTGASNFDFGTSGGHTYTVFKDVTVGAGCRQGIATASTSAFNYYIHGNLVVDGQLIMQNGAAYTGTAGRAQITFRGATTNNTATFNSGSTATLYDIYVDKNDGYEMYISSSSSATVNFFGNAFTILPIRGIMRLGANLNIPRMGNVGNYDLGSSTVLPVLWIDGATVTDGGVSGAIVPYGTLKITAGSLTCTNGQRSVVIRESGLFQIDGGTVNMGLFRTSNQVAIGVHRGSFVMNGGTFNLDGNSSLSTDYAVFSMAYADNGFRMSGGTINVNRIGSNGGGFMIGSSPQNYEVTGGTVNINITGNITFDITSRAPLFNVNINRPLTAGTGVARLALINFNDGTANSIPAYPLVVLNDLTLGGTLSTTLNANGNNISVAGNFLINPTGTLTSGANTLIFNGNAAQTFTVNGTLTAPGLNNLTVSKGSSSTLTIAGSAATVASAGGLNLLSGTLDDGGKNLTFGGSVINNATHTGIGKITLNGTTPQTIGGNGNGTFQNLEIASTSGAVGSVGVTATNTLRVNGNLNIATDRLLNIGIYRLRLQAGSAISSTPGAFSNNRYIQTAGFQSDGGIVKTFNSISAFVFPMGTATNNYTPATIQFTSVPSSWGTLNLRPVTARQLYVTDPDCFQYYWKVRGTGFSGIPANSVNLTFNYGNLPDNATYIPGYYNYSAIGFTTINDINQVNETSNNILFSNVSYFDGDFTAGAPPAFGIVVPYYSRANGNWNTPATWSNTAFGGPASGTIPSASTPVFIGDGVSFFHTVSVTNNNTLAGSLIIDAGSTLNVGTTTGHNFGALPYATAGGAGKLQISSTTPVAEFPGGDFGIFFTTEGGTTEYFSSGTSFTIPSVTAAPTNMNIVSYRNLSISPGAATTITLPNTDLEIFENMSNAGAGVTQMNNVASRTLTIRENLDVNGGTLRYRSGANQSLVVDNNINVSLTGAFDVENAGTASHNITVTGNLTNNGFLEFNQASKINLSFIGNVNRSISGTNGLATTSLNNVVLNKGTGSSVVLDVNVAGAFSAPTNNWLTLTNGTFRLSKSTSLTLTDQAGVSFLIPATAAIELNHPGATMNVAMGNSNTSDLILGGSLRLISGTMNVGDQINNTHNDIEYVSTGAPSIQLEGSSILNVNGQIRRSVLNFLGALTYSQVDNSVVLVRGKNPGATLNTNHQRAKFEIVNDGSSFTMEDNSLLIIDRNGLASGSFGDLYLFPETSVITGGEIRVGTSGTPSTEGLFVANILPSVWTLTVDGTVTPKTLQLVSNPLTVANDLDIFGNSIFNANGLNVTIGGSLINQNPINTTGLTVGGYRVVSPTQVTTFNGALGSQSILGTSGNLTNFANLVINNTFTGGEVTVAPNTSIRVNGNLQVTGGHMNLVANTATVTGNITNNNEILTTGAGNLILAGTAGQDILGDGTGIFGSLRLNNAAGAEVKAPITVGGTLNLQTGLFYINNHELTITETGSITGTFGANVMVRTNGVLSDGGIRKLYPASAHDFTFPFGVTLKYSPARINVTSNSVAGSVTIRPVNTRHPATTDPLNKELTYYWNVSSTGFNPSTTLNHTYTYIQADALNGVEASYVGGRYFNNIWTPQFGVAGSVNSASNTISLNGVNYFNGDVTAGESSEFDQLLVFYSRVTNGDWTTPSSWSIDPILQHTGAPAVTAPSFNSVVIQAGHTINVISNGVNAPTAEINGTLNLNSTIGHNLGAVTGTGTLRMTPTVSAQFIFPGGNFSSFVNATGGSVEYNSAAVAALPSQSTYNNLIFTGAGSKSMPSTDILINGDLTITAGSFGNVTNRNINLRGDFVNTPGVTGFAAGTGIFSLTGGAQSISGATQFGRLTLNGAGIKTLNSSISVGSQLVLTSGIVETGANVLSVASATTVSGGSAASHINGNLQKVIGASTTTKTFEIGDGVRYSPVIISYAGNTNNGGTVTAAAFSGDHPNIASSLLDPNKSVNRYYSISSVGVVGFTSANLSFVFNAADVDAGANTGNFSVGRYNGSWSLPTVGSRTATATQILGLTTFGDFQVGEEYLGAITWNGTVSSDWNNAANWSPNLVPTASDDIIIFPGAFQPSFLTAGNGVCKDVTFNPGTSLTVPSGYSVTVNGNWSGSNTTVLGSGTVSFTSPTAVHTGTTSFGCVLSVATGGNLTTSDGITILNNGSLMHGTGTAGAGGNVTGNVTVRRSGNPTANNYNYWSSPIVNGGVASLGQNRYFYNPVAATGSDEVGLLGGWINATGTMTVGRGYISTGQGNAAFTGTANQGPIIYGPTAVGAFTSFNLIGNPYPSAISAPAFVAANPSIAGSALYFWDDDGSAGSDYDAATDYAVWNNLGFVSGPNGGTPFNGNIASCQGFFIESTTSTNIQFNNAMRTTANSSFFDQNNIERLWISVTTAANDYNETLLAFKADATDGIDPQYDAKKLKGNAHISLYSRAEGSDLAIQAIPTLSSDKVVPLGIDADANGAQTIRLKHVDNMDATSQIILEDTKLGVFQNLRNNPVYNYTFDKNADGQRFRLHFKAGVYMSANTESCVQNDGSIIINSSSATSWTYNVTNSDGLSIASNESFTGTTQINNLTGGNYFVMLTNNFGTVLQQTVTIPSGMPVTAAISSSETTTEVSSTPIHFHANVNGAVDYTWDFGDGTIVTGTTDPSHVYTEPGVFTVTFIASNSNCMEVKTLQINVKANTTGIVDVNKQTFNIYPNPAKSIAMIQLNMPERELSMSLNILDAAGKVIMSRTYEGVDKKATIEVDIADLPAGVYQMLLNGNKFSTAARLTKVD
jgi:hypothetical protein